MLYRWATFSLEFKQVLEVLAQEHVRSGGVGKKTFRVNEHVFAVVISACTSSNSVNSNNNDVAASHPTTLFGAGNIGGEKTCASGNVLGATKQKPRKRRLVDSAAAMAAATRAKLLMELCGMVPSPKVYAMLIKV